MAKIFLHTLVFAPDGVSTAILVSQLMRELKKLGHEITVLTTNPHYNIDSIARSKQPLTKRLFGLYYTSIYENMRVIHVQMPRRDEDAKGRFRDYLFFHLWSTLLGLFLVGRQDVVITPSPPLSIGVIGWFLAKVKGGKFIYNVQELYPALTLQVGMLAEDSHLYKIFLRLEKLVYTLADHITVITPNFKTAVTETGIAEKKVSVIPNFIVLKSGLPLSDESTVHYDLREKFVILYAGNIGMTQSFDTIVEVIRSVQDEPNIHFLIVGDGVRRKMLEDQINALKLNNITLLPWQPLEEMTKIYQTAHLGLVPLMAGTARTTIPSKIYTIMANEVSVLLSVDTDSDMVALVQNARCGLAVPPDDATAMEAGIRYAYAHQAEFKTYGKNGRRYVEAHFSCQSVSAQYHQLIEQLASR